MGAHGGGLGDERGGGGLKQGGGWGVREDGKERVREEGASAISPQPSTLNPTPYTLHPTPYTLHPGRGDNLGMSTHGSGEDRGGLERLVRRVDAPHLQHRDIILERRMATDVNLRRSERARRKGSAGPKAPRVTLHALPLKSLRPAPRHLRHQVREQVIHLGLVPSTQLSCVGARGAGEEAVDVSKGLLSPAQVPGTGMQKRFDVSPVTPQSQECFGVGKTGQAVSTERKHQAGVKHPPLLIQLAVVCLVKRANRLEARDSAKVPAAIIDPSSCPRSTRRTRPKEHSKRRAPSDFLQGAEEALEQIGETVG